MFDLLNTELGQFSNVRILNTQDRNRILRKLGLDKNAELTFEQVLQIAREGELQTFLWGSLQKAGAKLRVRGQLFDTERGKAIRELPPVEGTIDGLHVLVDRIFEQVRQSLKLEARGTLRGSEILTTTSLDAFRFFLEGKDAALDNRHREAIAKLRRAINLDSTFIQPYYYLAWQYTKLYEYDEAKKILLKGKPLLSNLSEKEYLQYLEMEAAIDRRWMDYATYLERLMKINPSNPSIYFNYGYTQFIFFRQVDISIEYLNQALHLDSTFANAYHTLGYASLAKGEKSRALEMLGKYAALNPTDVSPLTSLADIQIYVGEYDEAIKNCERALLMQPDFHAAKINLARALMGQGQYTKAFETIDHYLQSTTIPSHQADGHLWLAKICFEQNRFERAIKHLENTLAIDDSYQDAYWLLGLIQIKMHREQAARHQLSRLESVLMSEEGVEDMWLLYHLKAELAVFKEDFVSAIDFMKQALALAPLNRSFYQTILAGYLAESGKLYEAARMYKKALAFNSRNARAALGLAMVLKKQGKWQQSIAAFHNVLRVWPGADPGVDVIQVAQREIAQLQNKRNPERR